MVFRNSEHNSLHTRTQTLDGNSAEWDDAETELAGLCAGCFIENGEHRETGIAMCECGDERCSYRWCGDTSGLHAYWRLHANGESQGATGIAEEDIFSYGPCEGHSEAVKDILNLEREKIREATRSLTAISLTARRAGNPANPRRTFHPVYLNPMAGR